MSKPTQDEFNLDMIRALGATHSFCSVLMELFAAELKRSGRELESNEFSAEAIRKLEASSNEIKRCLDTLEAML